MEGKNNQVKSKRRVTDHGEVFTNVREVNAMIDLVKQEAERIDSRFLEPACGSGNFLIEILKRKMNVVSSNYRKNQIEWEKYATIAVSSCYGVDILEDNCIECIERLFLYFKSIYLKTFKLTFKISFLNVINFILTKNIICGDALTMLKNDGKPIVFSERSFINDNQIKRKDYTLSNLLETENYYNKNSNNQIDFFNMLRDEGTDLITPKAIADFQIINFYDLLSSEDKLKGKSE